ncbi:hypothetical protein C6Q28_17340 [Burkholderia multivorans]|nr:hypothetical protein C6Q28_17340 [Burkholderia multivorans]
MIQYLLSSRVLVVCFMLHFNRFCGSIDRSFRLFFRHVSRIFSGLHYAILLGRCRLHTVNKRVLFLDFISASTIFLLLLSYCVV